MHFDWGNVGFLMEMISTRPDILRMSFVLVEVPVISLSHALDSCCKIEACASRVDLSKSIEAYKGMMSTSLFI